MLTHAARLVLLLGLGTPLAGPTEAAGPERPAPTRLAQTPPSAVERQRYTGLHAAAARGDTAEIERLLSQKTDPNGRDGHGRTPLHVAAFGSHDDAVRALVRGGANPNAFDVQRYDIVTIAAVKDDVALVTLALSLGTSPGNITSPTTAPRSSPRPISGTRGSCGSSSRPRLRSITSTTLAGPPSSRP